MENLDPNKYLESQKEEAFKKVIKEQEEALKALDNLNQELMKQIRKMEKINDEKIKEIREKNPSLAQWWKQGIQK